MQTKIAHQKQIELNNKAKLKQLTQKKTKTLKWETKFQQKQTIYYKENKIKTETKT